MNQIKTNAVLPTGKCFDDSLDLLVDILRANGDRPMEEKLELANSLFLVHGITTGMGKESAHAWIEDDTKDTVMFIGILNGERQALIGPRSEYYAELGVTERWRYLYRDAYALNRESGNYGPWEPRLQKLCRAVDAKRASITCPKCRRVSHNINDVVQGYCGACRQFHDSM